MIIVQIILEQCKVFLLGIILIPLFNNKYYLKFGIHLFGYSLTDEETKIVDCGSVICSKSTKTSNSTRAELWRIPCIVTGIQTENIKGKKGKILEGEQNQHFFPFLVCNTLSEKRYMSVLDILISLVCVIKTMADFLLFQFCAMHSLTVIVDQK